MSNTEQQVMNAIGDLLAFGQPTTFENIHEELWREGVTLDDCRHTLKTLYDHGQLDRSDGQYAFSDQCWNEY